LIVVSETGRETHLIAAVEIHNEDVMVGTGPDTAKNDPGAPWRNLIWTSATLFCRRLQTRLSSYTI